MCNFSGKIVNIRMYCFRKKTFLYLYIFVLNLVDAVLTHYSVGNGLATEINPLMDFLLQLGAFYFYVCKIALVVLGLALLKRLEGTRGVDLALHLCATIYTVICILHFFILA